MTIPVPPNPWDAFICHASEDKADLVRPLADALTRRGLQVWYDESELRVGDSLLGRIEEGLGRSRYGIVVLSQAFLGKNWPRRELDGLLALELGRDKVILPVWHGVTRDDVLAYSPVLADRLAANSRDGIDRVVDDLCRVLTLPITQAAGDHTDRGEPGPILRSHLGRGNSMAYATVAAGAVPERLNPLDELVLDAAEAWFQKKESEAYADRATDQVVWWRVTNEGLAGDVWQGWLVPGPVVVLIRAMEFENEPAAQPYGTVCFDDLAAWWAQATHGLADLVVNLSDRPVALGLSWNPYPVGQRPIEGVTFDDCPAPYRGAARHMIPPWTYTGTVGGGEGVPAVLEKAAESLLRSYSFRRLEPTISWLREGLATGALLRRRLRFPPAAGGGPKPGSLGPEREPPDDWEGDRCPRCHNPVSPQNVGKCPVCGYVWNDG